MYNCPICCTLMATPSVKIQEKQRILSDQDAKDVAQYIKERGNLEREIVHYCNFGAYLDIKGISRKIQDMNHREGDYKSKPLHAFEGIIILLNSS